MASGLNVLYIGTSIDHIFVAVYLQGFESFAKFLFIERQWEVQSHKVILSVEKINMKHK